MKTAREIPNLYAPAPTGTLPEITKPVYGASLRWNFSWTFVGNLVYSACQWGTLVLLAKLGNTEMVGQYGLALAVAGPIIALTNLQVTTLLTTDTHERFQFADYLSFRLLTTLVAMLVIASVPLVVHYPRQTALVVLIVGLAQAVEAVREIYHAQLQFKDHMDRIAKSMMFRAVLGLACLGVTVFLTHSIVLGAMALTLARAFVSAIYDMSGPTQLAPRHVSNPEELRQILAAGSAALRPRWNLSAQKQLLRMSSTLGVIALLVSLIPNIPRYFIAGSISEGALGIFAATASLVSAGNLIIMALAQSAFVRLAKQYAAGDMVGFNALLWKLIGIASVLGLGGVGVAAAFGHRLLTIIYRPEYAEHTDLLIPMMVAGTFGYVASLLGSAVTSARFFKQQIPMLIAVVAAAALSSWLLIPHYGLLGAGYAVMTTSAVVCVGQAILLWLVQKKLIGKPGQSA
jgi:O-antigen/teichoic acid export membrane protein